MPEHTPHRVAFSNARNALVQALKQLSEQPEVLIVCELDALLGQHVRDYRASLEALAPSTTSTPASSPADLTEHPLEQVHADIDAPEPMLAHVPSDAALTPPPLERPEVPEPIRVPAMDEVDVEYEVSLSPETQSALEHLPDFIDHLEQSLDSHRITRERTERLERALSIPWSTLPRDLCSDALHALVAHARALQEPGSNVSSMDATRFVKELFLGIKTLPAFSLQHVYGMALNHTPQHAKTWTQEARHWRERLLASFGHGDVTPPRSARQTHTSRRRPESAPRTRTEDRWPEGVNWSEGHVVIVGGKSRDELLTRLEKASGARFEWVECDASDNKHRHIQSLAQRIKQHHITHVLLLTSFVSHTISGTITRAAKSASIDLIPVNASVGIEGILRAISDHKRPHPRAVAQP